MPTLAYSSGFSIAGHTLLSTHGLKHARVYTERADTTQIAIKSTHVISENAKITLLNSDSKSSNKKSKSYIITQLKVYINMLCI